MSNINILSKMTKEDIKKALKEKAMNRAKLDLNLDDPKTVQEKIMWLMVNDDERFKLKAKCADKILLHEYCKEKLGEDICIPILKTYDSPEDLKFSELPDKFVLKCNHGYAMNIIVDKKKNEYTTLKKYTIQNEEDCKKKLAEWLDINFGDTTYQWHYALIEPRCFAEKFMDDGHASLTDYNVWCCNGEPKMIQVISDRYTNNLHANIYDTDWNWFNLGWHAYKEDPEHMDPRPKELDKMLEYARKLSEDFTFVRVDFYIINDKLYLGELTFSPDGGIFKYKDRETELYWGDQIDLNDEKTKNEGVSVCVTAYKASAYIKECLDSISSQTWFKDNNNYEILVGIDNCEETLSYVKKIQKYYHNLRVFMMDTNEGTYVTTNTLLNIAKYNNIIRFDSDDVMLPNLVSYVMENKGWCDIYNFAMRNFGLDRRTRISDGVCYYRRDFLLKYGGYQPWRCGADSEMKKRLKNFANIRETREILFLRRTHDESLTRKSGDTCIIGKIGSYRKEKLDYVSRLVVTNEKDAHIKMVTNTYKEILPNKDRKAKWVIYTCITGEYDYLNDPSLISNDFDYVCFSDSIKYEGYIWEIRPIPEELRHLSNVKQERVIKICPHRYLSEYDLSVWIDGNIDIRTDIESYISTYCTDDTKSVYIPHHPRRNCIYKEGDICARLVKDTKESIDSVLQRYRREGFPDEYGLVQTGVIIRRHNDQYCKKLMDKWAYELINNSHRDQLSFNYCLWIIGDYGFQYLPTQSYSTKCFHVYNHNTKRLKVNTEILKEGCNNFIGKIKTFILEFGYPWYATKYEDVFSNIGDVEIVECENGRYSNGYKKIVESINNREYKYIIVIRSNVNMFGSQRYGDEIIRRIKDMIKKNKDFGIYSPSFDYTSGLNNPSIRKHREGERRVAVVGDMMFVLNTDYCADLPIYDFSYSPSGSGFIDMLCSSVSNKRGAILVDDGVCVSTSYVRSYTQEILDQHKRAFIRCNTKRE